MNNALARDFATAVGVFLALLVLQHGAFVWGGAVAVGGDTVNQLLPMRTALVEGAWGWSYGTFGGRPLLADPQTAGLYPPNWLLFVGGSGPLPRVMTMLQVAHLLLGALGMWALVRRWAGAPAGLVAGAAWLMGWWAPLRLAAGIGVFVDAVAWVPWLWLATEWTMDARRRLAGAGLLGLGGGLQLLAGAFQVTQITWVGLGLWLLLRLATDRPGWRAAGQGLAAFVAGGLLSVAVAWPQLAITAEFQSLCVDRRGADAWAFVSTDSLWLFHLLTWFMPGLFGPGNEEVGRWFPFGNTTGYHEVMGGAGAVMFVLAVVAASFAARPSAQPDDSARQPVLALVVVALFGLLMAFGRSSPLYRAFFEAVPTFDRIRVPARWTLWTSLALAALAGLGAARLLAMESLDPAARRKLIVGWLSGAALVAALAAPFALGGRWVLDQWLDFSISMNQGMIDFPIQDAFARRAALAGSTTLGLALLAGILAWWLRSGGARPARVVLIAVLALALAEQSAGWWPFRTAYPAGVPSPAVETEAPFHRLADATAVDSTFYPRSEAVERIAAQGGRFLPVVDLLSFSRDQNQRELLLERPARLSLESTAGYQQLILAEHQRLMAMAEGIPPARAVFTPFGMPGRLVRRDVLDALNVRAVLTYGDFQPVSELRPLGLSAPEPVGPFGMAMLANPGARGWAWLSTGTDWLTAEPLAGAVVETISRGADAELYRATIPAGGAVLHVSSLAYPRWAWSALPAGAQALDSRSVRLPAGVHEVRREFRALDTGAALAALAAALLAFGLVAAGLRPGSKQEESA